LGKSRPRLRKLVDELARTHPHLDDPEALIRAGGIAVDGIARTNPKSLVRVGASLALRSQAPLRGERKLSAALEAFGVEVRGRVALDLGAAAGGFTRALLEAGARRVYAVDAGHGQLLGSLRLDARVVNLERTNLGLLTRALIPEAIDVLTLDLSYIALSRAVPQLTRVEFAAGADALALVKPQFELGRSEPPRDDEHLREAVLRAGRAFADSGWRVLGIIKSPTRGARGAIEFFLRARYSSSRRSNE
jgi:23S rRNA (cytidine1920-2'-O)/16S rRNA (cytidine1409-2'-O)-methyltransferase